MKEYNRALISLIKSLSIMVQEYTHLQEEDN